MFEKYLQELGLTDKNDGCFFVSHRAKKNGGYVIAISLWRYILEVL
ncbi:hypothetical protein L0Y69_01525 [bacterium]|nr:hypothetical protein [bacterium]